jgi:hypothetical protein
MFEKPPRYYTFVLRFWEDRSKSAPSPNWRFTLDDPERQKRYGFNSLEEMVKFLQERCQDAEIRVVTKEEEE